MKKSISLILSFIMVLSLVLISGAEDGYDKPINNLDYDEVSVIAVLKHDVSLERLNNFETEDFDCDMISEIKDISPVSGDLKDTSYNIDEFHKMYQLILKEPGKENVEKTISLLKDNEIIEFVEKNYIIEYSYNWSADDMHELGSNANVPELYDSSSSVSILDVNDYYFSSQYAVNNIKAKHAWCINTGNSSIKVGIISSGISGHSDFSTNINSGLSYNFTNESGLDDNVGYGTYVAGIVGAKGNNSTGVAGMCWNISLVNLKAFKASTDIAGNVIESSAASYVVNALNYASDNGLKLVYLDNNVADPILSVRSAISAFNGLVVVPAGDNGSANLSYPATYNRPNMLVVAATDANDALCSFSNYHATKVELAAPGNAVISIGGSNYYSTRNSTIASAAYVTGTAALLLSTNSGYSYTQLKSFILDNVDVQSSLVGSIRSAGRLNTFKSILDAKGYIMGDLDFNGSVSPSDARTALRIADHTEAGTSTQRALADIDGDGIVSLSDARTILQMSAGVA